ncbi:MAG: hypothetical protein ACRYFS_20235 [Janthinobacterium lividum]
MAQSLSSNSPAKPPAMRLIHVLIGGAGLVVLGGGCILMGLNSKLTLLQTSAQQKDAEVSSSEQIAHRYQTTLDNYNQTQAHIKYLEASVTDKSYVPTLLAQLQGLAQQTHLTMSSVRPSAPPPAAAVVAAPAASDSGTAPAKKVVPPPYDMLSVGVDVSGTYADTSMFLYDLTRFPKIISVGGVQMHPGPPLTPGGPAQVMTNLKLTAFIFHDADSETAPAGTPALSTAATTPAAPGMPPAAVGAINSAVGRAAIGAVAATKEANSRSSAQISTL